MELICRTIPSNNIKSCNFLNSLELFEGLIPSVILLFIQSPLVISSILCAIIKNKNKNRKIKLNLKSKFKKI